MPLDRHAPLPRKLSRVLAIALTVGNGLATLPVAHATESARTYSISIPAGPLAQQLNLLATQTGLILAADASLTRGYESRSINGQFAAEHALQQMLAGTGLQALRRDDGRYQLVPANESAVDALELGATSINADRLGDSSEGTGSYTTGSVAVGSKIARSQREVPHSVSVMTRQRIEDQNLISLTDVMDRTTGVTHSRAGHTAGSNLGNDSNFYARGFAVNNIQIDGGAPMDTVMVGFGSVSQLDMVQFDRVEFLRGIDGMYSGSGDPGGTINLVRKRALDHNQLTFSTSAGSWDNYRSELDVTGPLSESGAVRGRLGVAYQDRQFFYSPSSTRGKVLWGSVEFDLTPDTLLTVGGSYETLDGLSNFAGLPRYINGADLKLSRSTALTPDWNRISDVTKQGYAKLQHNFNDDWSLSLDALRMEMDRDSMGAYTIGAVDPSDGGGPMLYAFPAKTGMDRTGYSATLKGGFNLFELYHDVIIGADYQKGHSWTEQRTTDLNGTPIDAFDPVYPNELPSYPTKDDYHITKRKAAFAMTRLSLGERAKLSIGGRVADYSYENNSPYYTREGLANGDLGLRALQDNGVFTPYAGLSYELNHSWTAYASYAETFRPQYMQRTRENGTLEPIESTNYEVGLKGELFDGRLNTSLALYRAEQENVAVADGPLEYQKYKGYICCYVNQGGTVSQGIDAEISGELAPGWQLSAGYTYNHSRDKESSTATYRSITPKHLFKLWTTYRLPGRLQDWKVGAGAIAQSRNYVSGTTYGYNPATDAFDIAQTDFKFSQAGYTIWSGSLDYKIDKNWSATLNANNLFDKRYYQTVGNTAAGNFYGEPRNFSLTVRSKF